MKYLIIIPARGGSKGLENKNIKPLAGKPLVCYSVDLAREIADEKDICISTDSDEIINIITDYGLEPPFKRPASLATDTAGTYDVLLHAVSHYSNMGIEYDALILLQPTSPFRTKSDLKNAMELYEKGLDMVVGVKKTKSNPYFSLFEENKDGFLEISKRRYFRRRQDCPEVFEFNGAVYIINIKSLRQHTSFNDFAKIKKYVMNNINSVDIDNETDWLFCEFLIEKGLIKL